EFNSISNIFKINAIYLLGVFVGFIFGFIYVVYLVKLISEFAKKNIVLKNHLLMLLLFSLAYVPLLNLYVSHLWTPGMDGSTVASITLIVYCFLGFFGLGLSRHDLRAFNLDQISGVHILLCALLALAFLLLVVYLIIYRVNPLANERLLCAALAAYLGVFLVIAHIVDFRLWERHVMPGLPLFLLIIVSGYDVLWKKVVLVAAEKPRKNSVAGVKDLQAVSLAVVALLLLSSANLRYNPYYQQANAKGALAYVRELLNDASGDRVIFARFDARSWTYRYYGINAEDSGARETFENNKVYHITPTDPAIYKQLIANKPPGVEYVFVFNTYFEGKAYIAYFDEQGFAKNTDYHLVDIYTVD
ncbi:MAG: hypothetical protein LBI54_05550, partial [Lachnospiraceae bacterium]|nr:hypothetical protein [Lachnospiraceae bacterium]